MEIKLEVINLLRYARSKLPTRRTVGPLLSVGSAFFAGIFDEYGFLTPGHDVLRIVALLVIFVVLNYITDIHVKAFPND